MNDLKPCPFCGGTDIDGTWDNGVFCENINCEGQIDFGHWTGEGAKEAVHEAWNTRPDQWQPIETAPKDGTAIIVGGGTAEWNPNQYGWFSHQGQAIIEWEVTHWMPLPEPPKENG